jgi:hypothetical protein
MTPVQGCPICGGATVGFGNDAWPVNDRRCCDQCNAERVIPALRLLERETKRQGSNGGALPMIHLNDVEDDSFVAIQAADFRWLYDLWGQLANESRPLHRQAIAKRLADVLENAEFF